MSDTTPTDGPLAEWNNARARAARIYDAVENDDNTYPDTLSDSDWALPAQDRVEHVCDEAGDSRAERVDALARWLREWEPADEAVAFQYAEASEAPEAAPSQSRQEQAAAEILDNFRNYEGRYGELIREYDELALPPKPDVMMKVQRLTGVDRAEAVDELVEYLEEWDAAGGGAAESEYGYGRGRRRQR